MSDRSFVASIDLLDDLVLRGDSSGALAWEKVATVPTNAALCVEVAQLLLQAGLLSAAERWCDLARGRVIGGARASDYTSADLGWLRANIAWESARFEQAVVHLRACELASHGEVAARALGKIALALSASAAGPARTATDGAALAREALRDGGRFVRVRHGAAVLQAASDERALALNALAVDETLSDPEGAAYRDSARSWLGLPLVDALFEGHELRAYESARRRAVAVTETVRGQHLPTQGAIFVPWPDPVFEQVA